MTQTIQKNYPSAIMYTNFIIIINLLPENK